MLACSAPVSFSAKLRRLFDEMPWKFTDTFLCFINIGGFGSSANRDGYNETRFDYRKKRIIFGFHANIESETRAAFYTTAVRQFKSDAIF